MDTLRRLADNIYRTMTDSSVNENTGTSPKACGAYVSARQCAARRPLAIVRLPFGGGGCSCEPITEEEIITMFNQNR